MAALTMLIMDIDVYSSTGQKQGTLALPESLFGAPIRQALMHQAVVMQQANRRHPIAHAKRRSEVEGSTRKVYAQKHTGRARRGSVRSPLLRGGGKSFGPRSEQNFSKDMPRGMRRAALVSALSLKAKEKAILGLAEYPQAIKTKDANALMKKLPVELGRRILLVLPEQHDGLTLSTQNIPGIKTVLVQYLNPEDILVSRHLIFLAEAVKKAEELFGKKQRMKKSEKKQRSAAASPKKKATSARSRTRTSSESSASSASS